MSKQKCENETENKSKIQNYTRNPPQLLIHQFIECPQFKFTCFFQIIQIQDFILLLSLKKTLLSAGHSFPTSGLHTENDAD